MKSSFGGFDGSRGTKRGAATSGFTGAIGFEAFRVTPDAELTSTIYTGNEESLRLPFRALLTKKDPTTKIKALGDLEGAFRNLPVESVRDALSHWAFLYERCQKDNDRRVRLRTAKLMAILVERLPKAMGERRFDTFAADWLCSCFDPEHECSVVSRKALDEARNANKSFSDPILNKIYGYIRQQGSDEALDEFGGSQEEVNERSLRLRSQALKALAFIIESDKSIDLSSMNDNSNWYKFLLAGDSEGGFVVRGAAYQLLAVLASNTDHLSIITSSRVMKSVFRIVSEKDRMVTVQMWNALIAVCKNCSDFFQQSVDTLRKGFFPELFRHLERRANGVGFTALSNYVVLLSLIPESVWESYGTKEFCEEWFERLIPSHSIENRHIDATVIMLAAVECICYLLKQDKITLDDKCKKYLTDKLELIIQHVLQNAATISLSPHRDDIYNNIFQCVMSPATSMTAEQFKNIILPNDGGLDNSIALITGLLKAVKPERKTADFIQEAYLEVVMRSLMTTGTDDALCALLSFKLFSEDDIKRWLDGISLQSHPKCIAKLISSSEHGKVHFESLLLSLQKMNNTEAMESLLVILTSLTRFNWVLAEPSEMFDELVETSYSSQFDGKNEDLIAHLISPKVRIARLERLAQNGISLVECDKSMVLLKQSEIAAILQSYDAYPPESWPPGVSWVICVLRYLNLSTAAPEVLPNIDADEVARLSSWINATISSQYPTIELDHRWAKLVGLSNCSIIGRPIANLSLALLEACGMRLVPPTFSSKEEMIWWTFCNKSRISNLNVGPSSENWLRPLVTYLLSNSTKEVNSSIAQKALDELLESCPNEWFAESDESVGWITLAARTHTNLAQTVFIQSLLCRLDSAQVALSNEYRERIQSSLRHTTLQAASTLLTSIALKMTSSTPSPSSSPVVQNEASALPALKAGDSVIYDKGNGHPKSAATVIARHDEAGEPYYTIRWWAEDRSRETQTTRDKLRLRSEISADQAKEEDNKKKLIEIQKLLQEARQSGNRQESIRLMRLQAELLPKPKDTDEEKAKIEAARAKAEAEWREKKKAQQFALIAQTQGGSQAEEPSFFEDDSKVDWDESIREGLTTLSRFLWRKDSYACSGLASFSEDEDSILKQVVMDCFPHIKLSGEDNDITILSNVLCLPNNLEIHPDSEVGERLSRLVIMAASKRSPSTISICQRYQAVISESAAGCILNQFCKEPVDDFTKEIATCLGSLSFSSKTVWDYSGTLASEHLIIIHSTEMTLAAFTCLYRYPKITTMEPLEEEHNEEQLLSLARSYFPDPLLAALDARLTDLRYSEDEDDSQRVSSLLVWLLCLRYIHLTWKINPSKSREAIGVWLRKSEFVYGILGYISAQLDLSKELDPVSKDDDGDDSKFVSSLEFGNIVGKVASRAFLQTVHILPAIVRDWWSDHLPNRFDKEGINKFTATFITPNVLKADMRELNEAVKNRAWDSNELTVKFSLSTRVVTILSFKDDCSLEMEITFPDSYPLFPAQVECTKQIGVRPDKWKRWALQIVMLLSKRDGTLSEAVQIWKKNLDKEFEGVEPCPICYSVLHAVDSSLPRVRCKTCKNVFHGKCLSQWFTSSHQSLCPLCKQSFMSQE